MAAAGGSWKAGVFTPADGSAYMKQQGELPINREEAEYQMGKRSRSGIINPHTERFIGYRQGLLHMRKSGGDWVVTHLPSGELVARGPSRIAEARDWLRELNSSADWRFGGGYSTGIREGVERAWPAVRGIQARLRARDTGG